MIIEKFTLHLFGRNIYLRIYSNFWCFSGHWLWCNEILKLSEAGEDVPFMSKRKLRKPAKSALLRAWGKICEGAFKKQNNSKFQPWFTTVQAEPKKIPILSNKSEFGIRQNVDTLLYISVHSFKASNIFLCFFWNVLVFIFKLGHC